MFDLKLRGVAKIHVFFAENLGKLSHDQFLNLNLSAMFWIPGTKHYFFGGVAAEPLRSLLPIPGKQSSTGP